MNKKTVLVIKKKLYDDITTIVMSSVRYYRKKLASFIKKL